MGTMTNNEPIYVKWTMRHYGSIVGLLHYIVTETADRGVDIAARALALAAPLPNAISIYHISQVQLKYTEAQAFAFAMVLELVLFALIEVALYMWDGYLDDKRKYLWPFVASVAVSFLALGIVVSIVFALEVRNGGHPVMATLPFISMASFVGIGLKRWHERNKNAAKLIDKERMDSDLLRTQLEDERKRAESFLAESKMLRSESELMSTELESLRIKTESLRNEAESLRSGTQEMQNSAQSLRDQVNDLRTQLEDERKRASSFDIDSVVERLDPTSKSVLLGILDTIANGRVTTAADAAKEVDANKTKVYEMFRLAQAIGVIYPNGDGAYHVRN